MTEGFISITGLEKDIDELVKKLSKIEKSVKDEISTKAVQGGAEILLSEEKRLIQSKYPKFADWLKINVKKNDKTGNTVAYVGYNTETIREHFEVLVVEFGRPGISAKSLKRGNFDKRGRRIGVVQPTSHIRAAMFSKKEAIANYIGTTLMNEVERIWEER